MTEEQWLRCEHPRGMLSSLFARSCAAGIAPQADERFRRFAIACCRRVERVLEPGDTDPLDWLEVYAEDRRRDALLMARRLHRPAGTAASNALARVDRADLRARLFAQARALATSAVWTCTKTRPTQAAMAYHEAAQAAASLRLADEGGFPRPGPGWQPPSPAELAVQCRLLRDVFGNPFRPATAFDPAWGSDTVVSLARGMYESGDFSAMPILADALEDAGCDDEDVLAHCRDRALPHVRGCWVTALFLGKR